MQTNVFASPSSKWWVKYKLYHIPFWFVYHYMWWVVLVGSPVAVISSIFYTPYVIKYVFYVVFQALGVYFNLYYLIPTFLEKGKYGTYIILVLTTIVLVAICIVPGYYAGAWISGQSYKTLYGADPKDFFYFFQVNTLASSTASMTLGMSVKLAKNWLQTKRREQLLEKEKLETELKFLKYQFNPHFLFNTINSIFVLIHKNPDMASDSLAKFSELLRHQLYESNESMISLANEITYLENFIELEKLRQNNYTEVKVEMMSKPEIEHLAIAPFILMTFVENAFKHISRNTDVSNWINIKLEVIKKLQLHFTISNSVTDFANKQAIHYSGIGLKNVQRRLDLVYPDSYSLHIEKGNQSFCVDLIVELSFLQNGNIPTRATDKNHSYISM